MRKKIVTLVDDLDGSDATETVRFGLDGAAYEIDLSDTNAAALRGTLSLYTTRGRSSRRPPRTRTTLAGSGGSRNA